MDASVYLYRYTSIIIHCGIFVHRYTIQSVICGERVDACSCGRVCVCVCVCVHAYENASNYSCVWVCVCVREAVHLMILHLEHRRGNPNPKTPTPLTPHSGNFQTPEQPADTSRCHTWPCRSAPRSPGHRSGPRCIPSASAEKTYTVAVHRICFFIGHKHANMRKVVCM